MQDDRNPEENGGQHQALEPVEQETILFHGQTIMAVRLADGRICVVLRWVCDSLKLQSGGQVRRIERTATTADELVRVRIQTRGGRQTMPAITLRGFSPWVLGINPNEVKDEDNPEEAERIRALIAAYQTEAKDVLYEHFVNRQRPVLPEPRSSVVIPAEPVKPMQEPEPGATQEQLATYHEAMALWHRWQADRHAQQWRGEVEEWRGSVEAQIESKKAMLDLIPEILERLGPQTLTPKHQNQVRTSVHQLSQLTKKPYQTIHEELKAVFEVARYQDIPEEHWPQVEHWFTVQIERAKKK